MKKKFFQNLLLKYEHIIVLIVLISAFIATIAGILGIGMLAEYIESLINHQ
jgi:hypothetical protein